MTVHRNTQRQRLSRGLRGGGGGDAEAHKVRADTHGMSANSRDPEKAETHRERTEVDTGTKRQLYAQTAERFRQRSGAQRHRHAHICPEQGKAPRHTGQAVSEAGKSEEGRQRQPCH